MAELAPWFQQVLAMREEKAVFLPWFQELTAKVEEDPEMVERNTLKAEGDFVSQLATTIRKHEGGRFGYDAWFGRGTNQSPVAPPKSPTAMTVDEVLEWQNTHNPPGNATTAIGAYQIVDQPNARTLSGLKRSMNLTGSELFTPELQDRMAVQLMRGRGLDKFLAGKKSPESFANQIAREWASLPVLRQDSRRGRVVSVGQSYYSGDGINRAFRGNKEFEAYKNIYALADIETGE
jgi:muramidase (phage lysozyme)